MVCASDCKYLTIFLGVKIVDKFIKRSAFSIWFCFALSLTSPSLAKQEITIWFVEDIGVGLERWVEY